MVHSAHMPPSATFPVPVREDVRDDMRLFRVTKREYARLRRAASAAGSRDFSTWARWAVLEACKRTDPPSAAKAPRTPRTRIMRFRLDAAEASRLDAAMSLHEMALSEFARRACLAAVR